MSAHQIHIGQDGTIRFLHTDDWPPGSFPHAQVQRASEIEWDAATRHWAVRITVPGQPTRATVFAHALRHVCVLWEVNHVNAILRALD